MTDRHDGAYGGEYGDTRPAPMLCANPRIRTTAVG